MYRSARLAREARQSTRRPTGAPARWGRGTVFFTLGACVLVSAAVGLGLSTGERVADRSPPPAAGARPAVPDAQGALFPLASSELAQAIARSGRAGFVALPSPETVRRARVTGGALFDLSIGSDVEVRFVSERGACGAEIVAAGRVLYSSRESVLACVRGFGGETTAWDALALLSFTFGPDEVTVFDTGGTDATLTLRLAPPVASVRARSDADADRSHHPGGERRERERRVLRQRPRLQARG